MSLCSFPIRWCSQRLVLWSDLLVLLDMARSSFLSIMWNCHPWFNRSYWTTYYRTTDLCTIIRCWNRLLLRPASHEILSQALWYCSLLLPSELNKPYLDWLKSTEMWAYGLPSCSSQSERKRRRFLVSRFRFGLTLFAELFALPLLDGDWLHVLFILL